MTAWIDAHVWEAVAIVWILLSVGIVLVIDLCQRSRAWWRRKQARKAGHEVVKAYPRVIGRIHHARPPAPRRGDAA